MPIEMIRFLASNYWLRTHYWPKQPITIEPPFIIFPWLYRFHASKTFGIVLWCHLFGHPPQCSGNHFIVNFDIFPVIILKFILQSVYFCFCVKRQSLFLYFGKDKKGQTSAFVAFFTVRYDITSTLKYCYPLKYRKNVGTCHNSSWIFFPLFRSLFSQQLYIHLHVIIII